MSKALSVNSMTGDPLPVYSLDFETYYDSKTYTLKKLTTIEYVRDARFKAHGCAVVDPGGHEFWVTHKELPNFFKSVNWSKHAVLHHNSNFDGLILSEHYGVIPAYWLDTMAMSRGEFGPGVSASLEALTQRLGNGGKLQGELEKTDGIRDLSEEQETALIPYALNDAVKMRKDFEDLYFDRGYPEQELHIIDLTIRTFTRPLLRINAALCKAEIEAEDARMKILLESDLIGGMELSAPCVQKIKDGGITALMRSRDCFAEMLRARGIEPPIKERMKAGVIVPGEFTYAFAKNDIEMQILGDDPRVSDIVAAWTGLKSTMRKARAERFLSVTHDGTKTLPIPLMYCGGRTHRWSGCLVGTTSVLVKRRGVKGSIFLEDIQATDLVWDGEEFVAHKGVISSGIMETIEYAGLRGTRNHPVLTVESSEYYSLEKAAKLGLQLVCSSPTFDKSVVFYPHSEEQLNAKNLEVFDILDCGPRSRFSANNFIVHNSDSLNPQNLNSGRDGRGSRLREAIEAPPGFVIVDLDLAQIELRVSAWFSGETELLEDLRQGRDPYSKLASEIFGVEVTKNNENYQYRFVGKEGELSLGFGVGHKKFFNTIQTKYNLPIDQFSELDAQKTVNLYRAKRTGIVRTWNEIKEFIPMMAGKVAGFDYKMLRIENDKVRMPNDLYMHYKDLHWHFDKDRQEGSYIYAHKKDWVRIYAAKMYENWIQSIARSIVAEQAVRIAKELPVVLLVHDQIMSLAPEKEADAALAFALETMRTPPSWCSDLPLDAEGHTAKNYVK